MLVLGVGACCCEDKGKTSLLAQLVTARGSRLLDAGAGAWRWWLVAVARG